MPLLKSRHECRGHANFPGGGLNLVLVGHRHVSRNRGRLVMQRPFYVFTYLTKGSGQVFYPQQEPVQVDAGDWFFGFPEQVVLYEEKAKDPWQYYWVGFHGEAMSSVLSGIGIERSTLVRLGSPDKRVPATFEAMLKNLGKGGRASMLKANAGLWHLLALLGESAPVQVSRPGGAGERGSETYVQAAEGFIANQFAAGVGANDVAEYMGFERSYFSTLFHQQTGRTLREAIAGHRLARARELLAETELTVAAIAQAVGLGGARAFSRWFRQRTGAPPAAWRERQRSR